MGAGRGALRRLSHEPVTMSRGMERSPWGQERALLWNRVAGCVPPEDHDGVRRGRTGFRWPLRTVHDHRHLLRLCTSRCRLECRCIAGRAGPVGLVEHRPRRPEAAHSLSLDRAAGITRPIESASTLMPAGMLRGPKAAAARSARCTWVCVDVHTECVDVHTECVSPRDSPQSKRQQTTEACRCQL
jgi:hypothetical protein